MTDFSASEWHRIAADAAAWWAGELDRPLLHIRLCGAPPTRQLSRTPYHAFQSFYDPATPAADIVDSMDYELSRVRYAGDAFPQTFVNFGPGAIAAFLGCELENGNGTVWAHPPRRQGISELRLSYDAGNVWLRRMRDIVAAAAERWQGTVQVGMTDLSGNLDILSFFRPGAGLAMDLYDHPEVVKRLTWQAHDLWWRYFDELNAIVGPTNPGYTAWCPVFSESPCYFLQCDFAYMIGPDMFDEFVKPELMASCRRLAHSFYHLDGVGQLPHLPSLLTIPELAGVQWVPGDGAPGRQHWPDVYRRIHDAGKLIQISGELEALTAFEAIVEQIGTAKGLFLYAEVDVAHAAAVQSLLERWEAPASAVTPG